MCRPAFHSGSRVDAHECRLAVWCSDDWFVSGAQAMRIAIVRKEAACSPEPVEGIVPARGARRGRRGLSGSVSLVIIWEHL
jgi:hypothetical protein